jgi:RNA polymerase sigma factor (sigma-70 family)
MASTRAKAGPTVRRRPGPSPSEAFVAQERDEAFDKALAQLPEHYRQVVRQHNQENLSFEEIGRLTGQTADAVRKIWLRFASAAPVLGGV